MNSGDEILIYFSVFILGLISVVIRFFVYWYLVNDKKFLNKKNVLISVVLIFFLLSSISSALHISQDGVVSMSSDPGDERHPVVCELPNGNLLAVWSDGSGDVGSQFIEGKISTNDGVSWGSEITIYPVGGNDGTMDKDPELFVTPNGTVALFFQDQDTAGYSRNYLHCLLSYDNASTWVDKGRIGENFKGSDDARRFTGGDTYGNTMYFCGESYMYSPGFQGTHFWKSEDNCQSFTLVNDTINTASELINEWDIVCLSASHFVGAARDLGNSKTYRLETWDAGVSWTITDFTSNVSSGGASPGTVQDPDVDWLNREQGVIIMHGRFQATGDDRCGYMISDEDFDSFTNYTELFGSNLEDEYTGFAEMSEGDQGYLVYSGSDRVYGRMIYDLTSYPPSEYSGFQSINNVGNNTVFNETVYFFNWSNESISGKDYYQLVCSNDSGFTDVFLTLNVNESVFAGNYSEKGGYVEFILPNSYRRSWYGSRYYRVRVAVYFDG